MRPIVPVHDHGMAKWGCRSSLIETTGRAVMRKQDAVLEHLARDLAADPNPCHFNGIRYFRGVGARTSDISTSTSHVA